MFSCHCFGRGCSASRGKPKAEDSTEAGNAAALMKRAKYLNEERRADLVTGTMNGWTWPSDYQSSLQCSDRPGTRSESQVCGLEAESGRYEQSCLQHRTMMTVSAYILVQRIRERLPKAASHISFQSP